MPREITLGLGEIPLLQQHDRLVAIADRQFRIGVVSLRVDRGGILGTFADALMSYPPESMNCSSD